jgi:REP element-mobilizing transposase RayT
MARLPRLDLPGIPQHIVQRGNDRQACFADAADYLRYRQELGEAALRYGCALHAYVLMTNHVHLLTTPHEPGGVSRMMQAIGRRYVGGFNARYRRTGTLWEGRFKSALVDSEHYALACYRYIELNPVRAGIVTSPRDYRWSTAMPATRTARTSPASLRTLPTSRWERMTSHGSTHIAACSPAWTQTASMRCVCIRSSRNHGAASGSASKSKRWLSAPWKSDHAAGRDRMRGNEPDPFSPAPDTMQMIRQHHNRQQLERPNRMRRAQ